MPEYKLVGKRRDNGQAVKFRVEQPDEASVLRLAQKRGIIVTSIKSLTPEPVPPASDVAPEAETYEIEDELDRLALSASQPKPQILPDVYVDDEDDDHDDDQDSQDAEDTVDVEPATAAKAPMYRGVKFCASVFTIMGGGLFVIAIFVLLVGIVAVFKAGLRLETLTFFAVFFSFLLASAIWLGAAFMMEMLRDLTRHMLSQSPRQ